MTSQTSSLQAHLVGELALPSRTQSTSGGKSRNLVGFSALAIIGLLALWLAANSTLLSSKPSEQVAAEYSSAQPHPVTAQRVHQPVVNQNTDLEATGYIVARQVATVSSQLLGELAEVHIEEGRRVQAGEVLARLRNQRQQAAVALAHAQWAEARASVAVSDVDLAAARTTLDRNQKLASRRLISQADLDQSEQEFSQAQARLNVTLQRVEVALKSIQLAQVALDNTIIRAPFDGVVINKTAQVGEIVAPSSGAGSFTRTGIGTIVDMRSIEIEVDVSESQIKHIAPAQHVRIALNAYPQEYFTGYVIAVIPTANRNKATIRVRVGIDSPDARFLPQMSVRVTFLDLAAGDASLG